ncbi:MAG: hypothetical protein CMI53_05755 [Parcubacteria group bacterium]|nr:hypothetical protein [Parcubacteria group bacterium]|tara:strand:+ start:4622 stop:5980 length:1359 start_codon:yes stop_codon:yes gene_type:complete
MEIVIDFSSIPTTDPIAFAWWFFKTIGWIFPVFLFVYGLVLLYQNWIRNEYRRKRSYILLAIDIPRDNEQSPRAVQNMFQHLSGAHQPLKFHHKWWKGEVPESFSFEIVSIGGYIQFIIHTEKHYRDFIEALVYAQYPDAEITEVEDYVDKYKSVKFPHNKYQLFGSELKLTAKEYYPLITFKEFEDTLAQELKDPMSGILESMSRMGPGEEMWVQFLVTPADNDWKKTSGAQAEIDKIVVARKKTKNNWFDWVFQIPNFIIEGLNPAPVAVKVEKDEPVNQMLNLTQGAKDTVTSIEHKTAQTGFHTRIRYVYIAEHEKFNKMKAFQAIYGAFKQFNSLGSNGLKNDSRYFTAAVVYFKKIRLIWRRNKLLYRYRYRGHWLSPGEYGPILISEELASLWHFPTITTKAPMVQKTEAKKAEPPTSLPTESTNPIKAVQPQIAKSSPPENLPT